MNSSTPLYRQVATKIKNDIISSKIGKDEAILPENKLAEKYNVSRVTIRQAIQLLVQDNILYKVHGSGTYVKTGKIEHDIFRLQGFTEEMLHLNQRPTNKILDFRLEAPNEEAAKVLQLRPDEQVFFVRRLRCIDNEPLILEESYLPVELFSDLSLEVMTKSKYEYIEKKGYVIKERQGEMVALNPDENLRKILEVSKDMPLLYMNSWSTLEDGTVFEFTKLYFRSDKYTFKFSSKR